MWTHVFLVVFSRNEYIFQGSSACGICKRILCGKKRLKAAFFKSHDLDAFTSENHTGNSSWKFFCFVSCVQKGSVTGLFHFLNVLTSIGKHKWKTWWSEIMTTTCCQSSSWHYKASIKTPSRVSHKLCPQLTFTVKSTQNHTSDTIVFLKLFILSDFCYILVIYQLWYLKICKLYFVIFLGLYLYLKVTV